MDAEEGGHVGDGAYVGFFVLFALGEDHAFGGYYLGRVDNGDAPTYAETVEALAHHAGQLAVVGARDVVDADLRGIDLAARPHRADHGDAALVGLRYEEDFGGEGVDGVDHVVERVGLENLDSALVAEVLGDGAYVEGRVDVAKAVGEDVDFRPADGGVEGYELTVDVRRRHGVGIDNGEVSYAGAHEHLGGVGSYAAHPDHKDAERLKTRYGVGRKHERRAL